MGTATRRTARATPSRKRAAAPARGAAPRSVSREKLLAAAEKMILRDGFAALRTRELVAEARVNISLITYYFGGLEGLTQALLQRNVDLVMARQAELVAGLGARKVTREALLQALLVPLIVPAAFTPRSRAALVVQEILTHASGAYRRAAEAQLQRGFAPLLGQLVASCPHLTADTVIWRFCCVCAGGISMSPRAPAWQLFRSASGNRHIHSERDLQELVATADGALARAAVAKGG